MVILLFVTGYVFGSVLFGEIVARLKGIDIRKVGSGNVGATNVKRALGKKYGVLVFFLDMLKGFIPVFVSSFFPISDMERVLISISPILGHLFPVFYKFKGGKGVATSFGVILALSPLTAVICLFIWIVTLAVSKYVSLASIISVLSSIPVLILLGYTQPYIVLAFTVSVLIIFAHRSNIQRLIKGTEHKAW